jgi:hypothetical protein
MMTLDVEVTKVEVNMVVAVEKCTIQIVILTSRWMQKKIRLVPSENSLNDEAITQWRGRQKLR